MDLDLTGNSSLKFVGLNTFSTTNMNIEQGSSLTISTFFSCNGCMYNADKTSANSMFNITKNATTNLVEMDVIGGEFIVYNANVSQVNTLNITFSMKNSAG